MFRLVMVPSLKCGSVRGPRLLKLCRDNTFALISLVKANLKATLSCKGQGPLMTFAFSLSPWSYCPSCCCRVGVSKQKQ